MAEVGSRVRARASRGTREGGATGERVGDARRAFATSGGDRDFFVLGIAVRVCATSGGEGGRGGREAIAIFSSEGTGGLGGVAGAAIGIAGAFADFSRDGCGRWRGCESCGSRLHLPGFFARGFYFFAAFICERIFRESPRVWCLPRAAVAAR